MSEPIVHWRADGTPVSPRFGDIYRSAGTEGAGGLAQARQVFLHGCALLADAEAAAVWRGAARWAVLETGFGLGLNFLATWQAWRNDPARPRRLFYSAVEAFVAEPHDLLRSAAPFPELAPLAAQLAVHWRGLLPGVHRIELEGGRLQLTLAVGDAQAMLAELGGAHDSIFLDGFNPTCNPEMWSLPVLKAVARLARHGAQAATWCVAHEVRDRLAACGFSVERVEGLPPKHHALRARYQPRWPSRRRAAADDPVVAAAPARCAVVGAGLAGASVAYSLAQRGWQVTVLDRASEPAPGASGLPAGVLAPHVSPDDRPLSRLTRSGVRATLARAQALLREGRDFGRSGVLERHAEGERRLPPAWAETIDSIAASAFTTGAEHQFTLEKATQAGAPIDARQRALWHAQAGWIRPAALVRAMLGASGVTWQGGADVARIEAGPDGWVLRAADGRALAEAELVFVTAGFDSLALLDAACGHAPPLHALRGQVAYGPMPEAAQADALPRFPVNGHGSLIAHLPGAAGPWWITGATFERGNAAAQLRGADHEANRERLAELLPAASAALSAQWTDGRAQAWAGVRATLPDRLPAVGAWAAAPVSEQKMAPALDGQAPSASNSIVTTERLPIHMLSGLGARGLTLAVLCGEIAAAWLHDEPLPVARSLARRLRAARWPN